MGYHMSFKGVRGVSLKSMAEGSILRLLDFEGSIFRLLDYEVSICESQNTFPIYPL